MKSYINIILLISILIIITIPNNQILAEPFSFISKVKVESFYNNNIYKLSENDLTSFDNNTNQDRFEDNIETTDDLITSLYANVGIKHKIVFNHLQIIKAFFNYDYLLKNNGKKSLSNAGKSP